MSFLVKTEDGPAKDLSFADSTELAQNLRPVALMDKSSREVSTVAAVLEQNKKLSPSQLARLIEKKYVALEYRASYVVAPFKRVYHYSGKGPVKVTSTSHNGKTVLQVSATYINN